MKSLKPKETQEYALTKKTAEELKDELIRLQASVVALQSEIEQIEDELDVPTVGRGSPSFDSVTTTDLTVNRDTSLQDVTVRDITANSVTSPAIDTANANVSNVLSAEHVNTPDLDAEVGSIDQLQSENISVDVLAADEATIPDLTATTATIGTANITTANIGTYNVAKVDATEVETPLLKATESVLDAAAIDEAEIEDAVINTLETEDLWNRNRYFKDDTRRIQITDVTEDQPGYICVDTKGVQTAKIVAKDDQGELFTVIYSNTRGAPLIQWSKRTDFTLNKFFYGFKSNKLYLQIWQDCSIQWQIDAFEDEPFAPTTYSELPEPLIDLYRYNVGRKSGIVLMGDSEDGTVLSVQGTIEGNFLVDSGEFTYVNFYSDSAYDLFKVAKAFFRTGSDEDGWRYEKAQVFGYLRHTDTVAPAYEPYTFSSAVMTAIGELTALSGPRTSADTTFVDTDPLVTDVFCAYTTGGSTQLYTTVNGEYKKILKICTTTDSGTADVQWPIVWVEGDDVTSLAGASIRLLEPRTAPVPDILSINYYNATGASHSPYRDEDNTEIEALEKVEYVDENTILLTIDNKYGQDEITIEGSSIAEDEKLPFVLGFTFRTPKVDAVFNEDADPYPGEKAQQYFYGD